MGIGYIFANVCNVQLNGRTTAASEFSLPWYVICDDHLTQVVGEGGSTLILIINVDI